MRRMIKKINNKKKSKQNISLNDEYMFYEDIHMYSDSHQTCAHTNKFYQPHVLRTCVV